MLFFWILVVIGSFIGSMPILSWALDQLNIASDAAVTIGVVTLLGLSGYTYILVRHIVWNRILQPLLEANRNRTLGSGSDFLNHNAAHTPDKEKDSMTNHTFRSILLLFVVGMALSACTRVEPGWVGIKVNEWGDQRGVEDFPIQTGKVTYNLWTETVYKFPTFLQNVVWTADENEGSKEDESITFNSIEGAVINADIAMSYSINGDMVPAIFVEFRKDIDHITDVYVRSQVRDAFSRHASMMKATDIFGSKKQELLTLVKDDLNENLGPRGFTFDMVSFVGGLRVEEKVQESIDAVLRAAQRAIEAENKIRQSEAEAQQMIAAARGDSASAVIRATGEAEANRLLSQSLTNDVVSYKAMLRWDGVMPQVTGSGGIPLIQLPAGGN